MDAAGAVADDVGFDAATINVYHLIVGRQKVAGYEGKGGGGHASGVTSRLGADVATMSPRGCCGGVSVTGHSPWCH